MNLGLASWTYSNPPPAEVTAAFEVRYVRAYAEFSQRVCLMVLGATSERTECNLPVGRRLGTFDEMRSTWGFTEHRSGLIDQLEKLLVLVRKVVPVCAVWVSGSFLTDKEAPSDIDVVLLIDEDHVEALPADGARHLVTRQGLVALAHRRNFQIDAFVINWRARPSPRTTPADDAYLRTRGYWDDFWLRSRTQPKSEAPTRDSAIPRRGYVEVIVDGYK